MKTSRLTAKSYSTSFSIGIRCLDKPLRNPIYAIYGFVRFADEIVDTFHAFDKKTLFNRFKEDTWRAIDEKISLNPILHSFQEVVNRYQIDHETIRCFLKSMEMDLTENEHTQTSYERYILGSAEVVGLMCLRVFCKDSEADYEKLKPAAMKLGSAFQKVNFLRDLQADFHGLGRTYFPGLTIETFNEDEKTKIEETIAADFHAGYQGIKQLPRSSRLGVYVAFLYYQALFKKIKNLSSGHVMKTRIRIKNRVKLAILGYSFLKHQFNLI